MWRICKRKAKQTRNLELKGKIIQDLDLSRRNIAKRREEEEGGLRGGTALSCKAVPIAHRIYIFLGSPTNR